LQAGLVQRSINYNGLYWESQYDPAQSTGFDQGLSAQENFASSHFIYGDVGAGMIYTYKKNERYMRGNDQRDIQIGASVFHLNRPKYSFLGTDERLAPRLNIHMNGIVGIKNTNVALAPGILFSKQGPNKEIFAGTLFRYMLKEDSKYTGYVKGAAVSMGAYYRNKDAFVVAGLFEFSTYAIGASYDINTSKLRAATSGRGGLEITLRILNPSPFLFSKASFN
jgi:type IX secretion system PorP/SprF family membrane protein